jgi:chondroitin AC lyase
MTKFGMIYKRLLILMPVLISLGLQAQTSTDIEKIKDKLYRKSLGSFLNVEMSVDQNVSTLMTSIDAEGKWPDIDYKNQSPSSWDPKNHWSRLLDMTRHYKNPTGKLFQSKELRDAIFRGIDWWLTNPPQAKNYWYNSIGVPGLMGPVFVLLEKELNGSQLTRGTELMTVGVKPTYYDYYGKATGQNLLWLASAHLYAACLTNDMEGVKRVFREVGNEIYIADGEGIQEDFSFYQHGRQNYAFGYGKGFAQSAAQFMQLASQTAFQFPKEKVDILSNYILEGMQWMTRNGYLEYSAMGREISRKEVNRSSALLSALNDMIEVDALRKEAHQDFYRQLTGAHREKPLVGNRYFWRSDLMVHQRGDYYFSLKGTSNRIKSGESGNGENIKGFYQGNGTFYLIKRGDEYEEIFPVWDWRKLPGLLCEQKDETLPLFLWGEGSQGATSFVYGLNDGIYGCFGYDYNKDKVTAKRAWFMFDREIVNLISGASGNSLYQSINQCWLNGEVWTDFRKQKRNFDRVFHDSVGYCISSAKKLVLETEKQTGSWKDINLAASDKPISREVFSLGINLGEKVSNEAYSYTILPGISLEKFKKYRLADHVQILANTGVLQSVYQKDLQQVQAVFYEEGKLELPWNKLSVQMKKPGLVLIKKDKNKLLIEYSQPVDKKHLELDLKSENISKTVVLE